MSYFLAFQASNFYLIREIAEAITNLIVKEDISKRIKEDFSETSDAAFLALEHAIQKNDALQTDRLIRCIVFLSKGNIDELKRMIDLALLDPRDVMLWAEYDNNRINGVDQFNRRRDFNQTFENCEQDVTE